MELQVLQQRIRGTCKLPGLPLTAHKLVRMMDQPDAGASSLAAVVSQDPPLAACVMRAAYDDHHPARDLTEAIARIGQHSLKALIVNGSMHRSPDTSLHRRELKNRGHWRYCLAAAMGARQVATEHDVLPPGDVYLAGLLHGVGLMVLDRYFPEELAAAERYAGHRSVSLADGVREVTGMAMTRISALIMAEWGVDDQIVRLVGALEDDEAEQDLTSSERDSLACVRIGAALAQTVGIGLPLTAMRDDLDELRAYIGMTDDQWVQQSSRLEREFRLHAGPAAGRAA